jgi:NADH-quinone oxidoreductase subunit L
VLALRDFGFCAAYPGGSCSSEFPLFTFGEQTLRLGFLLDPLAAAMVVMIALVGLCIFVFSVGYMADDKNFIRFFAYLSFFSAAMLGLVIANSLLLLFIFWELVGLASYLLIGFWIEKPSAAAAAKKAFITTRIGDMGFSLEYCGSMAAVAHFFFTMAETVASKVPVWPCSARAPRSLRC